MSNLEVRRKLCAGAEIRAGFGTGNWGSRSCEINFTVILIYSVIFSLY